MLSDVVLMLSDSNGLVDLPLHYFLNYKLLFNLKFTINTPISYTLLSSRTDSLPRSISDSLIVHSCSSIGLSSKMALPPLPSSFLSAIEMGIVWVRDPLNTTNFESKQKISSKY